MQTGILCYSEIQYNKILEYTKEKDTFHQLKIQTTLKNTQSCFPFEIKLIGQMTKHKLSMIKGPLTLCKLQSEVFFCYFFLKNENKSLFPSKKLPIFNLYAIVKQFGSQMRPHISSNVLKICLKCAKS